MDWIGFLPQIIALGLSFYLVGALVLFCVGANRISTYCVSPVATCALFGILSCISALFSWDAIYVFVSVALLAVLALGVRLIKHRCSFGTLVHRQFVGFTEDEFFQVLKRNWIALIAGFLLNAVIVTVLFIMPAPPFSETMVNYDNPFHYSVIRHIIESGNASPIGAGSVMGAETAVYPDLSHAIIALNSLLWNTGIRESLWVYSFAVLIFVVPVGMNLLVFALFKGVKGATVVFSSILATLLPYSIPYIMFNFGVLLSNYLGMALLPFALFAATLALRCPSAFRLQKHGVRARAGYIALLAAVCVLALGFAHPNMAITFAVLAFPLLFVSCKKIAAKASVCVGYIIMWAALFNSPLFFRTVNCLDRISSSSYYGDYIMYKIGLEGGPLDHNVFIVSLICLLPVAACVAIAFFARKRWPQSWYLASWGICITLLFYTMFPEDMVSVALTGFWYRDFARFMALVTFTATPLLAFLPQTIGAAISGFVKGRNGRIAVKAVCYCCMACLCGFMMLRPTFSISFLPIIFTDMKEVAFWSIHDPEEEAFMKHASDIADGALILNSNNDNSVWMYGIYGTNALIKGRPSNQISSMPDNEYTVITGIDRIGENSAYGETVRAAAKELGLEYVLKISDEPITTTKFNGLDQIDYQDADAILNVNESTPGLTLIESSEGRELYRIDRE